MRLHVFLIGLQIVRNLDGQTDPRLDQSENSQVLEQARHVSLMLSASARTVSVVLLQSGESEGGHDDKANVPPLFLLPFPGLSSSPPSLHPSAGTIGFRFCPFATASDS